jgi:hypothetical protein
MPRAGSGGPAAADEKPDEPLVYVGTKKVTLPLVGTVDATPRGFGSAPEPQKKKIPKVQTVSAALRKFDRMTVAEQHRMLRLLAMAGFAGSIDLADVDEAVKSATLDDAREAYKQLLIVANDYYQNSGLMVTPEDVLRSALHYRLDGEGIKWKGDLNSFDDGLAGYADRLAAAGEDLSGTTVQRYKSVDFMDPNDARALTRGMLQQELGRDPTQAEYEDFLSALHAAQKDNPDVTKVTSTTDESGQLVNQRTVTHQGISSAGLQQIAQDEAQSQPSWAEWQAMGTYAPALFAALGSAVPGV